MDQPVNPTHPIDGPARTPRRQDAARPSGSSRGRKPPVTARGVACSALTEQALRFPDLLTMDLQTTGLANRDAALAHTIYDTAVRRWLTIAYLCEMALNRKWSQIVPPLQGALLAGAAQLLFLDRVPAYAAINESVEWAKHSVSPGGAGLVNAGLRSIGRLLFESETAQEREFADTYDPLAEQLPLADGRGLILRASRPVLPTDSLTRLGVVTSHPRSLIESWIAAFDEPTTRQLAFHSLVEPPIILTTAHEPNLKPVHLIPHEAKGSAVFTSPHAELAPLLGAHPRIWVQDPSSAESVDSARNLSPALIVDLCAGQGTKTRQLACTFPNARIIATDLDPARLRTLREVSRTFPQVEVLELEDVTANFIGQANLVLLDVPCSNTGVFPRRPEARYRAATLQLTRLTRIQRDILSTGAMLLAPGATLLYATCSIDAAENADQVKWAHENLGLSPDSQRVTMPVGQPGSPATTYRDGSFSARLIRT